MFEEKEKREREGKRGATLLLCVKWYKMASRFGWASQSARVPARGRSDGTTNNISTTLHYLLVATTRLVSSPLFSSLQYARTHAHCRCRRVASGWFHLFILFQQESKEEPAYARQQCTKLSDEEEQLRKATDHLILPATTIFPHLGHVSFLFFFLLLLVFFY